MDDRTLLEMAARAAGMTTWWGAQHLHNTMFREAGPHSSGLVSGVEWNPLTDAGDALRLAVRLNINPCPDFGGGKCGAHSIETGFITEPAGADPYAATRRAIVRAAASIGTQAGG